MIIFTYLQKIHPRANFGVKHVNGLGETSYFRYPKLCISNEFASYVITRHLKTIESFDVEKSCEFRWKNNFTAIMNSIKD